MSATRCVRGTVWALALAVLVGLPALARAQVVPTQIYLSNSSEQWTAAQYPFNPNAEVSVYVVMSSQQHPGYYFTGQCVLSLAATHQELYRLRFDNIWMQPGQDVVRSSSFRMVWPQAPVLVTCSLDWAPALALSVTLGPELWYATGTPGTAYPTYPLPQPVYPPAYPTPQPTVPVYEPPPPVVPPPDCQSTLLAMGHPGSSLVFCEDVNQECAVALLEMGHPPSSLVFCSDIANPVCAVNLLRAGGNPSEIVFCE